MLFPEVWLEKEQEVGQSYTTDADCKSTCYPVLLTSGYKLEVSPTASLGSINLLERLRALKTHLFTGFLVYYKRIQLGNSQMEKIHRGRWRERARHFHALQADTLGIASCSPNWELSRLCPFRFWWKHGWLNHWPLVMDSACSSFPLSRGLGLDSKFQPSNPVVGSPSNQPPPLGAFQKPAP